MLDQPNLTPLHETTAPEVDCDNGEYLGGKGNVRDWTGDITKSTTATTTVTWNVQSEISRAGRPGKVDNK